VTESTIPRKPGRPKGSSRHNQTDALFCQRAADTVLRNPSLTNRAAIRQVIGNDPAGLRRLQNKFHREEMVAAAKARARAAEQAAAQRNSDGMRLVLDSVFVFQQAMRNIAASPFMQDIERMRRGMKVQQSPFMQALGAFQKTGAFSAWPGLPALGKRPG
jgi:hypothetical protein